jgi:hypothetical protein
MNTGDGTPTALEASLAVAPSYEPDLLACCVRFNGLVCAERSNNER